jgi:glycosyltransferase involved in cell wall biosynthesis
MRILILTQWYPPEPASLAHALACDLVKRGHQVLSITGFPNYPSGKIYPGYRLRLRQWEEIDGVPVLRLPLFPYHGESGARRALNFLSFATSTSLLGPILSGPADVMWVYHPPLTIGLPAWWIGLLRRVPFVYEIQDMWPETLAATGMMRSRTALATLNRLARFIYARAAAITVISPGFKSNLIAKGVPADKIHVIPNWADEDLYRPVPPDQALAIEHGLAGRFNIVYAGNMGFAQALDTVIEAAQQLRDLPEVQFVFIGDGVDEARLRQMVAQQQVSNVRFLGRQPARRMPDFFALADVLLVHLKRDPLFEITIPSKTLSYMACGRLILMAVAGDAADVVHDAGAGLLCAPQDPRALAAAVRTLYTLPEAERERMGKAGREAFLKYYTRRVLMDRYEALFKEIVHARQGRHRNNTGNEGGNNS